MDSARPLPTYIETLTAELAVSKPVVLSELGMRVKYRLQKRALLLGGIALNMEFGELTRHQVDKLVDEILVLRRDLVLYRYSLPPDDVEQDGVAALAQGAAT